MKQNARLLYQVQSTLDEQWLKNGFTQENDKLVDGVMLVGAANNTELDKAMVIGHFKGSVNGISAALYTAMVRDKEIAHLVLNAAARYAVSSINPNDPIYKILMKNIEKNDKNNTDERFRENIKEVKVDEFKTNPN